MNFDGNFLKVYVVTDNGQLRGRDFFEVVEESLKGGVTLIQLREKNITSREYYEKALKLHELTKKYNVPLIINDRVDIALAVGAEGVHVGQKDIPVSEVKRISGGKLIVGATANTVELALEAERQGADYIGSGAVFTTPTKDDAKPMSKKKKKNITDAVKIPVCAIGGINIDNVEKLKGTGIKGVAVSSGIIGADDVYGVSKRFFDLKF